MGGKEGLQGGLDVIAAASYEDVVPKSVMERQQKRLNALRVVQAISSLAGNEIPILPTPDAESIPREPGVYLFPDYDEPSNPIIDTFFTENPRLLSGRADSAHSVLTGILSSTTKGGEVRSVPVAVKCSMKRSEEERYDRAITELTVMSDLYQRGELGFKPIALAVAPNRSPMDGKLVIVSRFDGTITTMDNLPWGRGIDDRSNVQAAISAADAVGRFNAILGRQHGDAKIKNVAMGVRPNRIGLIDFETTERINPDVPFDASGAAHADFRLLVKSLDDKGFFNHQHADYVLGKMGDEYLINWLEASSEVFNVVHAMVEDTIQSTLQK